MSSPPRGKPDLHSVSELFSALLEASDEERGALLRRAASESPEVAAEVESLLAAHESSSILDLELDPRKAMHLMEAVALGPAPERVGPYRVVRELGRGGMGVVYLAERIEGGFEQTVALKLIKRGMDSEAILARFLRERQILAHLEHPGIARLVDGGLTESGQPYFAMERVEGEPLSHYCEREGLGVDERVELFSEVCRAVQYAHGRLVIHRDLKPSNVLVTAEGAVKLVDFGIAKVLDSETGGAGATELTSQGIRVHTPEYASPEQVRGEVATVAADVYALGVLFYELLVRESPYGNSLTTAEEVRRAVCETEPSLPSVAVLRNGEIADAERRRIARTVKGDLDRVALKALAKEVGDRYASVGAFVEDLDRYREGLPVRAHRAGWLYRTKKFVRRHRTSVAAGAVVTLAFGFGLGAFVWQAAETARERDRARLESRKAQATKDYLVSLFEAATPASAQGRDVTAKELLQRGIERLDDELGDQPEVRLEMLISLADVSHLLGEIEQTEEVLENALALAGELEGGEAPQVADLSVRRARILNDKGMWPEAEALLRSALEVYEQRGLSEHRYIWEAKNALAASLRAQGDNQAALPLLREAIESARELLGREDSVVYVSLVSLSHSLTRVGDLAGSVEALSEALSIARKVHGEEHPEVATILTSLAGVTARQGRWIEAERYYREGITMERRLRGDQHARFAFKLHNLATVLAPLGREAEAAALHRECLDLLRENVGESSPYYATTLDSLASDLADGGQFEEALPLFAEAEEKLREAVGAEHSFYAFNRWRWARAYRLHGDPDSAVPLIEEAIARFDDNGDNPVFATMIGERADIELALGDLDQAERSFREALALERGVLPERHPNFIRRSVGLGWIALERGRANEVVSSLREAVALAADLLPPEHWSSYEAQAALGAALVQIGERREGQRLLRGAQAGLAEVRWPSHPAAVRAARYLGGLGP